MEANKDAAMHYLELAEKAIRVDDIERAVRYINKSEDLFPTQKAKGKYFKHFIKLIFIYLLKTFLNESKIPPSNQQIIETLMNLPQHLQITIIQQQMVLHHIQNIEQLPHQMVIILLKK